jgi:hypothetical protein
MFDAFVNNAADFSLLQSAVTFQSSAGLQTVEAGWINVRLIFILIRCFLLWGARSTRAALGAAMIPLSLCFRSWAPQLLSSLSKINRILY